MASITDDFDPLTIPKVLDQKVTRVLPDGKPAQAMLDYEQQLSAWMRANTANTNERFELVKDETDSAIAAVATETEARIDGDTALAQQITTVVASIDDQMANGQIVFQAKAAPGGATASYGLFLTAGTQFTGFEAVADSRYGSAIGMTASRFLFMDSGTGTPILGYSAGLWQFNANVGIHGSLVVDGTINNVEITDRATTQTAWAIGTSHPLTSAITVRQGAYIQARGTNLGGEVSLQMYVNSSFLRSIFATQVQNGMTGSDPPVPTYTYTPVVLEYVYGPLSAGSYTFELYGTSGSGVEKTLILTELAK
jgi:hypothetical protein